MAHQPSRRDVLRLSGAALGSSLALPGVGQSRPRYLRFAAIGVGGKGWSNIENAERFGVIVGLCDVDQNTLKNGLERWTVAKGFADFRIMLDELDGQIDAVLVSTPDHTHAVAAAAAMRRGKAVYCEKPLARSLWETRRLIQIAKESGVATQMGNQGTAHNTLRLAAAHLQAKTYGDVRSVHCWTDRPGGWWSQGSNRPEPKPKPEHVNFDLWLGPSPERPYADGYHPFAWRGWWDFGTGAMGDIACHCMNMPFMGIDLKEPIAVQAKTSGHNRDSYPAWSEITYEFAENRNRPELSLIWYDGGKKPAAELAPGVQLPGNGCLIVCEKATLYAPGEYASSVNVLGAGNLPDIAFERSPGHVAEWVAAIHGGKPAASNIVDHSGPLTEMALVGNLAVWADGPKLEWDAKRLRVKGTKEYDDLIRPKFRRGWSL
jgi:predicted dehydrogenase